MRLMDFKHLIIFVLLIISSKALAVGAGITYHGRLIDPNGNPVIGTSVQFKLQIRTPGNENCLMYEEVQVKDLSQGNGVFSVTINDGTGTRMDSSGYAIDQIFANRGTFTFAGGYCVTGNSFAPNPTDGRRFKFTLMMEHLQREHGSRVLRCRSTLYQWQLSLCKLVVIKKNNF